MKVLNRYNMNITNNEVIVALEEKVNQIISEDYADFVVESSQVQSLLNLYPDAVAVPINFQISLVTFPIPHRIKLSKFHFVS